MEIHYGVIPTDYDYPPGDLLRYGGFTEPDMIGSAYDMEMTKQFPAGPKFVAEPE